MIACYELVCIGITGVVLTGDDTSKFKLYIHSNLFASHV